ncbi:glu S.griseus protease inhibitor-like [Patiria miniata]|uniref:Uncharacterized protein n=1 Tax=Patiria miniata TaxID=46514 RepID=A0A914AIT3_PATMI|nr:glu S.griseus protease inhibitor-like [Patiria miniata]
MMAGKSTLMFCCTLVLMAVLVAEGCRQGEGISKPTRKETWPELVGQTGEEAKAVIEREDPTLEVEIVPYGYAVTADYRTDRVRIYLDAEGRVATPPTIG